MNAAIRSLRLPLVIAGAFVALLAVLVAQPVRDYVSKHFGNAKSEDSLALNSCVLDQQAQKDEIFFLSCGGMF